MEWYHESFVISDEPDNTSVDETFALLQTTYWAHKRPLNVVQQIIERSLCFFLRIDGKQIGFARVITDFVTTSWLADVVLHETYQKQGLGEWMMKCVLAHPQLKGTQFALQTADAHVFYERLGFTQNAALMSTRVDYL